MKIKPLNIAIIYGSSTCYTEIVSEKIQLLLPHHQCTLLNIRDVDLNTLHDYDFVLFGIPTWDYGVLQEDWDNRWDELEEHGMNGLKCAIFGLGDQIGYSDWFQDAMGYLYHLLKGSDAQITGASPNQGYDFNQSKALSPDKTSFYGLALDEDNQPELTESRLKIWLAQIGLI